MISTKVFLNEEGKFVENVLVLKNEYKGWLGVDTKSCYFTRHFAIIWSGNFIFIREKTENYVAAMLCSWVERIPEIVKCLAQKHSIMTLD